MSALSYKHVSGGGVPGGHNVISRDGKKPYIPGMETCHSIPLRHTDVVVDLGAYCGTYAIYCARFPVKMVYAYEPTPFTFSVLSQTKLPNLKCVNAAVISTDHKYVNLNTGDGLGDSNSVIKKKKGGEMILVNARKYTDVISPASVLKIDVEGAEYTYPIVENLTKLRAIIIDFHKVSGYDWLAKSKDIIRGIESAGFKPVKFPYWDKRSGIDVETTHWSKLSDASSGSWIRDIPGDNGVFEPMMIGKVCCGCGCNITGSGKSLCPTCFKSWSSKNRVGYSPGTVI